jgi:FG-GAP repeat protein
MPGIVETSRQDRPRGLVCLHRSEQVESFLTRAVRTTAWVRLALISAVVAGTALTGLARSAAQPSPNVRPRTPAGSNAADARGRPSTNLGPRGATSPLADFNGDGYADLAVSALYEDVNGQADAGAVNVMYGGAAGLQTTSPAAQLWTENSPGMPDSAVAEDQFGWTLSYGDFNGDGYSDLAVAVPHKDVTSEAMMFTDAGQVDILYGSSSGLSSIGVQAWTEATPGVLGSIGTDNNFGRSLATGDFNADGYADLAIEIRGEDVDSQIDAGAVDVLYGGPGGLQTASPASQIWTENSPRTKTSAQPNDWFGRNLTTGDFNGDGIWDLAAGIFLKDIGSFKDAGAVEIIYGTHHGLDTKGPRSAQFWNQNSPGVRDQSEGGDYFGHTVAGGDFNADGYDDLAIGVRLEDIGSVVNCGAVEVLYGSGKGLRADAVGSTPDDQFWYQGRYGMQDQKRKRDEFGFSLSVGDFNRDGMADLAIGIPFKDIPPGAPDAGQVAVLYGVAGAGLQAVAPDDQIWNENSPGVNNQAQPGDEMSISVIADDFNGDGVTDLAVGIAKKSIGPLAEAGGVAILYGVGGVGLQAEAPDDQLWDQTLLNVSQESAAGDQFGWWVT